MEEKDLQKSLRKPGLDEGNMWHEMAALVHATPCRNTSSHWLKSFLELVGLVSRHGNMKHEVPWTRAVEPGSYKETIPQPAGFVISSQIQSIRQRLGWSLSERLWKTGILYLISDCHGYRSRLDWDTRLPSHTGEDQHKPSERAGSGVQRTWILILVALPRTGQVLRSVGLGFLVSKKNSFTST